MNGLVLVMGWLHATNYNPSHGNVGVNPFDFSPFDLVLKCDLFFTLQNRMLLLPFSDDCLPMHFKEY